MLIVIIPSYGPPVPRVPSANITGGVFSPTARPRALFVSIMDDSAVFGSVAFAFISFAVVPSALSADMYVSQSS